MSFEIRKYNHGMKREWDAFIDASRNSTFLFQRDYMDYHSDRFSDFSCMAYKGNRLMALLPANLTDDGTLHSHQGLTYGGWILPQAHLDGTDLLEIFSTAIDTWKAEGIRELDYKPLPSIYHLRPSQEDIYALSRLGAEISEVTLSMAIPLSLPVAFNKLRRRSLAKASSLPISISETTDLPLFMKLLENCLRERHDTAPVHTATELAILRERFPENIRLFVVTLDGEIEAGVCIYDTGIVAHTQYIATTERGREFNLLTPLIHHLVTDTFSARAYFDFGTSNQSVGSHLNAGLLRQKASFGATGVAHLRYRLPL